MRVGWQILDCWAFNFPERLRALEAQGELLLLGRLLEQTPTPVRLDRLAAREKSRFGIV